MKTLLVLLLVLVAVVVGGGFLLPTTYAVERSTTIEASPTEISPYLQDLKKWQDWTVWNSQENPELKTTYVGAEAGSGARMEWTEGSSGTGSLEIAKVGQNGGIEYDLNMSYSMIGETVGKGTIALKPTAGGTEVQWTDEFTSDGLVGRWMGLFSDVAVGGMLEQNLEELKSKAEGSTTP